MAQKLAEQPQNLSASDVVKTTKDALAQVEGKGDFSLELKFDLHALSRLLEND